MVIKVWAINVVNTAMNIKCVQWNAYTLTADREYNDM